MIQWFQSPFRPLRPRPRRRFVVFLGPSPRPLVGPRRGASVDGLKGAKTRGKVVKTWGNIGKHAENLIEKIIKVGKMMKTSWTIMRNCGTWWKTGWTNWEKFWKNDGTHFKAWWKHDGRMVKMLGKLNEIIWFLWVAFFMCLSDKTWIVQRTWSIWSLKRFVDYCLSFCPQWGCQISDFCVLETIWSKKNRRVVEIPQVCWLYILVISC